MVKSYAQTICLKNDPRGIEEYKRHHADCWPEVLGALKAVGVLRMKIFLLETRMFMYMETEDSFDPEVDFPRHLEMSPRCVEWGKLMSTFQTPGAGGQGWGVVGVHGRGVRLRVAMGREARAPRLNRLER